jgi:hypothetical protein
MTPSEPGLRRPKYFNGMELGVDDFVTERVYFDCLRRLYNSNLHTWGIARGLDVAIGADRRSLRVSPGLAIDPSGQEILLESEAVVRNPRLGAQRAALFVACEKTPGGVSQASLARGYGRIEYVPVFSFVPQGSSVAAQAIFLATAKVGADGNIEELELEARHYCGFDVGTLAFRLPQDGSVAARIFTSIEHDSPLLEIDASGLRFTGLMGIAGTLSIGRRYPRATLDIVSADETIVSVGEPEDKPLLTVLRNGNSSIGAVPPSPSARLTVKGNIYLDANHSILFDTSGSVKTATLSLELGPSRMQFVEVGPITDADRDPPAGRITLAAGANDGQIPTMSIIANGNVGIGDAAPKQALSVNGPVQSLQGGFEFPDGIQTTAAVSTTVPVGGIVDWWPGAGDFSVTLPTQFMVCDGSKITRGPLKDNNLPDLRGRYAQGTADFVAIGKPGGAISHTHQITSLPSHTHGIAHWHNFVTQLTQPDTGPGDSNSTDSKCTEVGHTHTIDIELQGSNGQSQPNDPIMTPVPTSAQANQPPSMCLVKIMRIL